MSIGTEFRRPEHHQCLSNAAQDELAYDRLVKTIDNLEASIIELENIKRNTNDHTREVTEFNKTLRKIVRISTTISGGSTAIIITFSICTPPFSFLALVTGVGSIASYCITHYLTKD